VKKVKETSEHLLAPTAAMENAKWRSTLNDSNSPTIKTSPRPINPNDHLLSKTAAMVNASYKKSPVDEASIDPRERGWNNNFVKSKSTSSVTGTLTASPSESNSIPPSRDEMASISSFKVKETSSRLLRPTKANEYAKWDPETSLNKEPEIHATVLNPRRPPTSSDASVDGNTPTKKYREVPASLLRSTSGMDHGRYIPPEARVKEQRLSLGEFKKEVMDRLIRPTTAANHAKYIPPEERNIGEDKVDDDASEKPKVSSVSTRLLKLTVSNEHSKYVKTDESPVQETEPKPDGPPKVREVSARLLRSTATTEASKWKEMIHEENSKRSPVIIRNGSMTSSTRASRTSSQVNSRITSRLTSRAGSPHSIQQAKQQRSEERVIPVVTRGSRLASRAQAEVPAAAPVVEVAAPEPAPDLVAVDAIETLAAESAPETQVDSPEEAAEVAAETSSHEINLMEDLLEESLTDIQVQE
jgi:hypothetical protein